MLTEPAAARAAHPETLKGHVNNIPTMQSFTGIFRINYSVNIIYAAIIDCVCLGFPKVCAVWYSLTMGHGSVHNK